MNKAIKTVGLGTLGTYGLLKLPMNKIDPYTRSLIGGIVGFGAVLYGVVNKNRLSIWSGIGVMLGSVATLTELTEGAKIASNEYSQPVYALHETEGVVEIPPYQLPDYRIDGLTIKGMNGVFKAHNGVYLKILADGRDKTRRD